MKRVLIAHQSTIPHYRVPFYTALECLRPNTWRFEVVFDPSELEAKRFFNEPLDVNSFRFPIMRTRTFSANISAKRISLQSFWLNAAKSDLIIVGSALDNLTYPLCQLHQAFGTRFAYWGHGQDRSIHKPSVPKLLLEKLRMLMARQANGFFAYTAGVKQYLIRHGLSAQKIFVVNNTIDINQQREVFNKLRSKREEIKRELGLIDKKVLLFVGRMTANKRIDFLLRSFSILHRADSSFHLLLVGSGGETLSRNGLNSVSFLGPIVGLDKLGPIYVASDMYVFPGSVGLGPLQALCYDLPAITIDSDTHMPEIEYLLSTNSIVLKSSVTPEEYAKAILNLYKDPAHLRELKANIWPSIRHLTIEQMAQNFIRGVNTLLELP